MKDITVVGAGIAGLRFIEKIREKDPSVKITLIDRNPYSFSGKRFLESFSYKGIINLEEWSQSNNVEFVCDCIDRISAQRKKIYFKENKSRAFNLLVMATGLNSRKLEVKGQHREGFFYLSQINPYLLRDLMKISDSAIVYAETFLGVRLAMRLYSLEKEIRVIAKNWDFLGEDIVKVVDAFAEKKIPVYMNIDLDEAIGEGMVKAVKVNPLKVFSAQLLFIDSGFSVERGVFEEEVILKDTFFTQNEDLYIIGDANLDVEYNGRFFSNNYDQAKIQAELLAQYLVDGNLPEHERKPDDSLRSQFIEEVIGKVLV